MEITPSQAAEYLVDIMKAGLVPMLESSPGAGKSSIAAQIAEKYNLKLIDMRLAQSDPTDLCGYPTIVGDRAGYVPMNTFPIEGDEVPKGYVGWFLLLDEFNSAPQAVQAAAYRLLLDKEVGQHKLHKKVWCMAAGNKATDNAIVTRLGTATQSRMVHLELKVDNEDWLKWAGKNDIDHRIYSFISFKPDALHSFDPNHNDKTFPCPRTWEFVSRIIKSWSELPMEKMPILEGTIGVGAAREFKGYCEIFADLPSIEDILQAPTVINIPEQKDIIFALTGLIAHHITIDNIDVLIQFINRLPIEFQVMCLNKSMRGDKTGKLIKCPSIIDWTDECAIKLL